MSWFYERTDAVGGTKIQAEYPPERLSTNPDGGLDLRYFEIAPAPSTGGLAIKHDSVTRGFEEILANKELSEDRRRILLSSQEKYTKLLNAIGHANSNWYATIETLRSKAVHLNSLASIATFLGLLQIGFMTFGAQSDLHSFRETFDILSYVALLVDVFTGIFAVLTSGSISLAASPAKNYYTPHCSNNIAMTLENFQKALTDSNEGAINEQLACFQRLQTDCEREQQYANNLVEGIKKISKLDTIEYPLILLATSLGAYLFIVSTIIYTAKTQPRGASIAIGVVTALLTLITLLFVYVHLLHHRRSFQDLGHPV